MKFKTATSFLLFFLIVNTLLAQKPKSVLFIGNSYTFFNDMPMMVKQMANLNGDSLQVKFRVGNAYSYKKHLADAQLYEALSEDAYDRIILQEWHVLCGNPAAAFHKESIPYGKSIVSLIKTYQPCAQIYLSMPWAHSQGNISNCSTDPIQCTYEGLFQRNLSNFATLQDSLNLPVSPIGVVWNCVRELYPWIDLYDAEDKHHPSVSGSYLAACVNYIVLFKSSPIGLWKPDNLPSQVALTLQQSAWQLMQTVSPIWQCDISSDVDSIIEYEQINDTLFFHCQLQEYDSVWWSSKNVVLSNEANCILPVSNNCPIQITLYVKRGCEIKAFSKTVFMEGNTFDALASITAPSCPNYQNGSINLTISGENAPFSVLWNNNLAQNSIGSLGQGVYKTTITDAEGCSIEKSFELIHAVSPHITLNSVPACLNMQNGSIKGSISGNVTGTTYSWQWSNGITENIGQLNNLFAGLYTATVTSTEGCVTSKSIEVMKQNNVGAPKNLKLTNIQTKSASFQWDYEACATSYRLKYLKLGANSWSTKIIPATINTTTIDTLLPFSTYFVRIASLYGNTWYEAPDLRIKTTDTLYYDGDLDGIGVFENSIITNDSFANLSHVYGDCNDSYADTYPQALEFCDGRDNNCNNQIDELLLACPKPKKPLVTSISSTSFSLKWTGTPCATAYKLRYKASTSNTWIINSYLTSDSTAIISNPNGTGGKVQLAFKNICSFGESAWSPISIISCLDSNYSVYPAYNNIDCDNPQIIETCNSIDDNCNGLIDEGNVGKQYLDEDNDGFGDPLIMKLGCPLVGYVANNADCNDADTQVSPNGIETCNGKDEDCNGIIDNGFPTQIFYVDADQDGFGGPKTAFLCQISAGFSENSCDCDDQNPLANPSAFELVLNGVNEDCDNLIDDACSGNIILNRVQYIQKGTTKMLIAFPLISDAVLYYLQFRLVGSTTWVNKSTIDNFVLSNLVPGATYQIRFRTQCPSALSSFGPIGTFTMPLTLANCGNSQQLTSLVYENQTAKLIWNTALNTEKHVVRYRNVTDNGTFSIVTVVDDTELLISNLLNNKDYRWQVRSYCKSGTNSYSWSSYSTPLASFKTPDINGICEEDTNLQSSTVLRPSETNSQLLIENKLDNQHLTCSIFPNPTTGIFSVKSQEFDLQTITVSDLTNRSLKTLSLSGLGAEMDISEFPKGVYLLRIELINGSVITKQLLKQ